MLMKCEGCGITGGVVEYTRISLPNGALTLCRECLAALNAKNPKVAKLQAFKDWVHAYLDGKSVPHHPPGPHGAEGCRIGDRMDWVWSNLAAARPADAKLSIHERLQDYAQLIASHGPDSDEAANYVRQNDDEEFRELTATACWLWRELREQAAARPADCRGCGKQLLPTNDCIADGCPCNSPQGVNHGLVPSHVCTCEICDPQQTGSAHPADDDEPVTIAKLRAAGFTDFTEPDKYCEAYLSFWLDRREHNVAILGVHWARPDSRDGLYWSANGFTLYKGAHPKTMGDVRRLIRALAGASVG